MTICVVVLQKKQEAFDLKNKLIDSSVRIIKYALIQPKGHENKPNETSVPVTANSEEMQSVAFESIPILNPKLTQKRRQLTMAFWLMPFGFLAGLAFTKMTGLQTFSELGFAPSMEALIGGFVGMGSGWIGSHVAASDWFRSFCVFRTGTTNECSVK